MSWVYAPIPSAPTCTWRVVSTTLGQGRARPKPLPEINHAGVGNLNEIEKQQAGQ
jgi:hypothetical protein